MARWLAPAQASGLDQRYQAGRCHARDPLPSGRLPRHCNMLRDLLLTEFWAARRAGLRSAGAGAAPGSIVVEGDSPVFIGDHPAMAVGGVSVFSVDGSSGCAGAGLRQELTVRSARRSMNQTEVIADTMRSPRHQRDVGSGQVLERGSKTGLELAGTSVW